MKHNMYVQSGEKVLLLSETDNNNEFLLFSRDIVVAKLTEEQMEMLDIKPLVICDRHAFFTTDTVDDFRDTTKYAFALENGVGYVWDSPTSLRQIYASDPERAEVALSLLDVTVKYRLVEIE